MKKSKIIIAITMVGVMLAACSPGDAANGPDQQSQQNQQDRQDRQDQQNQQNQQNQQSEPEDKTEKSDLLPATGEDGTNLSSDATIETDGAQTQENKKLKTKLEGHKANISDDYQILKLLVENQKREEILNKWIAKKQKETYIRINDNWKNCDFQRDGWVKR